MTEIVHVMQEFNTVTDNLLTKIDSLNMKVEAVSERVESLQAVLNHTYLTINGFNEILSEILKREKNAMEKIGDIAGRFKRALNP